MAKAYGYQGAKVVMTARGAAKLSEMEAEFKAEGIDCAVIAGDPAIEADMKKAVEFVVATYGELNKVATPDEAREILGLK